MMDFTGKCALITGAAGGIGGAIARLLHSQGAVVALTDMNREGMDKLAAELGERVHVLEANLSDPEAPAELVKKAVEAMERIDILVNNAGLTRDNLAMRMKDEDWQLVIDVNLTAAFRLARACMRPMMKQRFGRVVGIASIVGVTGNAGQVNYAASKGGMIAMSKSLAQEVAARGITVNCVAPGFIATPMTDALSDEQKDRLIAGIPGGRLGTSDDVAASVAFLASDEAAYVTGQTIHVNGGMAMI
ncbi:MAG: 3-oxoacyl-[acyl-carrier-protein] reductase [Rhodospirillales bacterium]|jgi:3-oxoacyl-[acyl-carrier protein] reductase|nr:3-oxoacyl-[acyl-carrier-protein] reductase [Rhodospirillales bacterium]